MPVVAASGVGNTVGRLLVDFPLRVIRPNVAVVAGFRFAGLFLAKFVPQVAFLALANGTI